MNKFFNVFLIFFLPFLLLPSSVFALEFSDLSQKLHQALIKHQEAYPLYGLPAYDVDGDGQIDTLYSLDSKYAMLSPEEKAEWRARLLCNPKPNSSNLEDWANWRMCMAGSHVILIRHHLRQYLDFGQKNEDLSRLSAHFYMLGVHLDALTTGPEEENIFKITVNPDPPSTYKLRDTNVVMRYLPDASGIFESFGWGYFYQVLPRYYSTSLETPFDFGKSVKTINLWERIRKIHSAVATKVAGEWMIHSDGTLRTEYWDNLNYWNAVKNGQSFMVAPNTNFNPENGIGWKDLEGRRSMGKNSNPTSLSPHFFHWQMSGMTDAAKVVLNEGGIYQTAYDFGLRASAYTFAFDHHNINGDNALVNYYGRQTRGLSNYCDGQINLTASNPLEICQGGKHEWFEYRHYSSSLPPDQTGLSYSAQHLAVLMESIDWDKDKLPPFFREFSPLFYYAYKATFYKDNDSYIDFTNGGFSSATINKYFPDSLGSCGKSGFTYFQGPSGRVVNKQGETAIELLTTLAPSFAFIIEQKNPAWAQEILGDVQRGLNSLLTQPLSPQDSICAGGGWISNNLYARSAWQYNNLLLGYFLFKKPSLPTFVKKCDIDANGKINNRDIKENMLSYSLNQEACSEDNKNNSLDFAQIIVEKEKSPLPPSDVPFPQVNSDTLPDGIEWGNWSLSTLSETGLPPEAIPLDSRTVFKAPNGQWFDSVTKGNLCWNRVSYDYNNLGPWINNCNLNQAGFPLDSIPFDSRTEYRQKDGKVIEGITKNSQGWVRVIPTWFNPQNWILIEDLSFSIPKEALPVEARESIVLENGLVEDLWIKGGTLWYRTFYPESYSDFIWKEVKLKFYGFPFDAQSNLNTISIWKNPAGKWIQSITKGNNIWTRIQL